MGSKLYVGNLSYNTDEDGLRQAFESEGGTVTDVAIINDRMTGKSRGFGFVTMGSDDEAKAAMDAWNGRDLDGRSLRVNEAHDKRDGGGGGRGGPRGGGGGYDRGDRGGDRW